MSIQLGIHFESKRISAGLKPGQLATLAGWPDPGTTGGRICAFEKTGHASEKLIQSLAVVLGIDLETIIGLQRSRIGFHFQSIRIAAGLKPGELAALIGRCNVSVAGNHIRQFEKTGNAPDRLINSIATALGIDQATVTSLESDARKSARAAWDRWHDEPSEIVMQVRMMPTVWVQVAPPSNLLTEEEILAWAREHSSFKTRIRCISWSRRRCTYITETDTYDAFASFGESGPSPGGGLLNLHLKTETPLMG